MFLKAVPCVHRIVLVQTRRQGCGYKGIFDRVLCALCIPLSPSMMKPESKNTPRSKRQIHVQNMAPNRGQPPHIKSTTVDPCENSMSMTLFQTVEAKNANNSHVGFIVGSFFCRCWFSSHSCAAQRYYDHALGFLALTKGTVLTGR